MGILLDLLDSFYKRLVCSQDFDLTVPFHLLLFPINFIPTLERFRLLVVYQWLGLVQPFLMMSNMSLLESLSERSVLPESILVALKESVNLALVFHN